MQFPTWVPIVVVISLLLLVIEKVFGSRAERRMGDWIAFFPIGLFAFYALTLIGLHLFRRLGWM